MSIFVNRRNRRMPELNTSSLPDLIFTVLFFFMIVTNMRQVQLKVDYRMPQSRQLERLTNKQAMVYIHIGRAASQQPAGVAGMVIQLNDRYASVGDIGKFVSDERARMKPEDARNMRVVIKADRDTPMGLINDVKQALRRASVPDIIYSADQEDLR
ncbi:MAG: biopolymer transporter ExbD [Prevotella sp.]|nr:biopolymer transporter ExbD [Prevotella sp.]MDE6354976.1 biopolymer transporter ExbD [Prevotella sp.]